MGKEVTQVLIKIVSVVDLGVILVSIVPFLL